MENEIFEASYLYSICISETVKICPNEQTDLLRFLFADDSLKIKKGLEGPSLQATFFIKIFNIYIYIFICNTENGIISLFTSQVIQ